MKNEIKNTVNNLTKIESVYLPHPDGVHTVAMQLSTPVVIGCRTISPYALCRMCAVRLPLLPTERLILCLVLDELECGACRSYSYDELGAVIGKGEHSAKRAVAALRQHGLMLSSRIGRTAATVALRCDAFVHWAAELLSDAGMSSTKTVDMVLQDGPLVVRDEITRTDVTPDAQERPSTASVQKKARTTHPRVKKTVRAVSVASSDTETTVAKEKDLPSAGELPAGCRVDDHGFVVYDESSGIPPPPEFQMAAPYEGEFDSTIERADTLAAAGRTETSVSDDDDEDDISFGSETAETDMGQGVRMNPNI